MAAGTRSQEWVLFEALTRKFEDVFRRVSGKAFLSESNIADAMREVRLALLEADVNFRVVKDFVDRVSKKAVGAEVLRSVAPGQQFVKIVHDELVGPHGPCRARRAAPGHADGYHARRPPGVG